MKLVFLSDFHAGPTLGDFTRKIWNWVLRELVCIQPNVVVLGGDLWQAQDNVGQGEWLEELSIRLPKSRVFSVPGNRDPDGSALYKTQANRIQVVSDTLVVPFDGANLLLVNTNREGRAFSAIQEHAKSASPLIVACHQPFSLQELAALPERKIGLILSGHAHRHEEWAAGGWKQIVCAGLDPLKTIDGLPELLVVDVRGGECLPTSHPMPPVALWHGCERKVVLGIAPYATLGELVNLACTHHIPAIQAVFHRQQPLPTRYELSRLSDWRKQVPGSFLSYHLPDPELKASPLGGLEPHLAWCAKAGVNDYTIHLPNIDAKRVYADEGRGDFLDIEESQCLMTIYANLASRVLDEGGFLSLENHHNDALHFEGGRPDRLSSRPEHILRMISFLRKAMRERGYGRDEAEHIGWIFDSGHARNNGGISNELSLADWLRAGASVLQAAHIHQVHVDPKVHFKNHFAIRSIHEALINHEGLMAGFAQTPGPTMRAFVEVRDPLQAVESWRLLNDLVARRLDRGGHYLSSFPQ